MVINIFRSHFSQHATIHPPLIFPASQSRWKLRSTRGSKRQHALNITTLAFTEQITQLYCTHKWTHSSSQIISRDLRWNWASHSCPLYPFSGLCIFIFYFFAPSIHFTLYQLLLSIKYFFIFFSLLVHSDCTPAPPFQTFDWGSDVTLKSTQEAAYIRETACSDLLSSRCWSSNQFFTEAVCMHLRGCVWKRGWHRL